ncbi:hypothetical protein CONPUDRAFT_149928 [Coniophora puteana RWD-64-598 SS2]|uniref:Glycosyltransferase family 32 protein n=1 Tax=Coniophora puteana (strain RWD-64-598) TaxID=741705 RepID=A0A5M3N233_CONPW|nr:uncharacterized protein CONPUDRAFT_149928 [Coniophora puteana RWD-64-598 SS2]EIW85074.1 hypothetical protein CONPUDRAFT_149928 [Coniophora puteana RWD-64-598 SS2]
MSWSAPFKFGRRQYTTPYSLVTDDPDQPSAVREKMHLESLTQAPPPTSNAWTKRILTFYVLVVVTTLIGFNFFPPPPPAEYYPSSNDTFYDDIHRHPPDDLYAHDFGKSSAPTLTSDDVGDVAKNSSPETVAPIAPSDGSGATSHEWPSDARTDYQASATDKASDLRSPQVSSSSLGSDYGPKPVFIEEALVRNPIDSASHQVTLKDDFEDTFAQHFAEIPEKDGFEESDESTLVFDRRELQRIWQWEIASGHHPSSIKVPRQIGLRSHPMNPALPRPTKDVLSRFSSYESVMMNTRGNGPQRVYEQPDSTSGVSHPPRPMPGGVVDMDIIMERCDYSQGKYVRDCLEMLRSGAGLDNGRQLRRGKTKDWQYIYKEQQEDISARRAEVPALKPRVVNTGLVRKKDAEWERPLRLPDPPTYTPYANLESPCNPENPRLFHMFWTGPFTDKPYSSLLSWLYTQNLGLYLSDDEPPSENVCRPQFWLWINPGPAGAMPNPSAMHDMLESLHSNPWSAPFLHPRFKDVIQFKLWNTTEQLDSIPELRHEWRRYKRALLNSGGHIIDIKVDEEKVGSDSADSYDKGSVVLSDMARFVVCHRFGGIYVDADTIFLRDWEELWGWTGAFAYRWSYHEAYNTAVLRMNRQSAIGSFLFRTALRNGMDFHPMTIARYFKDAHLDALLLRTPDALFDSAWLNTEDLQRDRPPQPFFKGFDQFFDTPTDASGHPLTLGFEGFFRGAFSYHFHNFWWKPFDPARNWPDLGSRFTAGEMVARAAANPDLDPDDWDDLVSDDKSDLDWATVMKRTFESYVRGERPNMYGEWFRW